MFNSTSELKTGCFSVCVFLLTLHAVLMMQVKVLIRIPSDHSVRGVVVHFDRGVVLAIFSTLEDRMHMKDF